MIQSTAAISTEDLNALVTKHGGTDKLAQVSEKISKGLDAELAQRHDNSEVSLELPSPKPEEPQPITYRWNATLKMESRQPTLDSYA